MREGKGGDPSALLRPSLPPSLAPPPFPCALVLRREHCTPYGDDALVTVCAAATRWQLGRWDAFVVDQRGGRGAWRALRNDSVAQPLQRIAPCTGIHPPSIHRTQRHRTSIQQFKIAVPLVPPVAREEWMPVLCFSKERRSMALWRSPSVCGYCDRHPPRWFGHRTRRCHMRPPSPPVLPYGGRLFCDGNGRKIPMTHQYCRSDASLVELGRCR